MTPSGWRAVQVEANWDMTKAAMDVLYRANVPLGRITVGMIGEMVCAAISASPSPPPTEPLPDELEKWKAAYHDMELVAADKTLEVIKLEKLLQQPSPPPSDTMHVHATLIYDSGPVQQKCSICGWPDTEPSGMSKTITAPGRHVWPDGSSSFAPPSDALREALHKDTERIYKKIYSVVTASFATKSSIDWVFAQCREHIRALDAALLAAPSAGSAGQAVTMREVFESQLVSQRNLKMVNGQYESAYVRDMWTAFQLGLSHQKQAVDQQARRLIAEFLAAAELADQDDTDDSEVIARRNRDFFAAAQEVVPALRSLAHPETQDKEPQT